MRIYEFDVPLHIMPIEPYWMADQKMVIFPTDNPLPESDYWGPREATRILLYETKSDNVKKKITDLVIVLNFLNRNFKLLQWMFDKALSGKHLERSEKEIENLKSYVKQEYQKPDKEPDWYYKVDYGSFPLYELTPKPTRVDFGECFRNYVQLSSEDPKQKRIRELVDFFSYSNLSQMVMYKVYDNSNLQVSNSFMIIESLVLMDIKDQSGFKACPNCGDTKKAGRPIMDMVAEFIDSRIKDKKMQSIVLTILKKHYRTRNRFLHAAKYDRSIDLINHIIEKTGSNHIRLEDEIKYAGASDMGLAAINVFIRIELLDRLGYKSFN